MSKLIVQFNTNTTTTGFIGIYSLYIVLRTLNKSRQINITPIQWNLKLLIFYKIFSSLLPRLEWTFNFIDMHAHK